MNRELLTHCPTCRFENHIEKYPDDAGAKTVLLRILKEAGRSGEGELLAAEIP